MKIPSRYDTGRARPKFRLTAAKLAAVHTAARSRRRCDLCGPVDYIPREGICEDCRDGQPPSPTGATHTQPRRDQ